MEKETQYLFVYGTLMRGMNDTMHAFLGRHADFIDTALFQGKIYDLGGYPGAVASENPDERVRGEVFSLRDPETVFAFLDDYEACSSAHPCPTEYIRKRRDVQLQSGRNLRAWIYLYNLPTRGQRRIESGDYGTCQKETD